MRVLAIVAVFASASACEKQGSKPVHHKRAADEVDKTPPPISHPSVRIAYGSSYDAFVVVRKDFDAEPIPLDRFVNMTVKPKVASVHDVIAADDFCKLVGMSFEALAVKVDELPPADSCLYQLPVTHLSTSDDVSDKEELLKKLPKLVGFASNHGTMFDDTELSQLRPLTKLPNLRTVYIDHAPSKEDFNQLVESLPHLKEFGLRNTAFSDNPSDLVLPALRNAKALRKLTIAADSEALKQIAELEQLTSLSLEYGSTLSSSEDWQAIGRLSELRELNLGSTASSAEGAEALRNLRHLKKIDLSDSQQAKAILEIIAERPLETVVLGYSNIDAESMKLLASIKTLRSLQAWACPGVDDTGLRHFENHPLTELNIGGTAVTSDGMEAVGSMTQLRNLYLWDLELSEESMQHLKRLPHIEMLNVADTGIPEDLLRELVAQWPTLQHLDMRQAKASEEFIRELADSRPDLEIVVDDLY